jgi:hypothetical protein
MSMKSLVMPIAVTANVVLPQDAEVGVIVIGDSRS